MLLLYGDKSLMKCDLVFTKNKPVQRLGETSHSSTLKFNLFLMMSGVSSSPEVLSSWKNSRICFLQSKLCWWVFMLQAHQFVLICPQDIFPAVLWIVKVAFIQRLLLWCSVTSHAVFAVRRNEAVRQRVVCRKHG